LTQEHPIIFEHFVDYCTYWCTTLWWQWWYDYCGTGSVSIALCPEIYLKC